MNIIHRAIVIKTIIIILSTGNIMANNIVARTIYHEARGEGERGMHAVASVIWNRSQIKGKTLDEICLAPRQFSCWNKGLKAKSEKDDKQWKYCLELQQQMEDGTFDPSNNYTHYWSTRIQTPVWAVGVEHRAVIGRHVFITTRF